MTHPAMRSLLLLAAFPALGACKDDPVKVTHEWSLVFTLGASGVPAGSNVSYTVEALSSEGGSFTPVDWTLSSDEEPQIIWNKEVIRPSRAGMQHLHATSVVHGELLTADADIPVAAGPTVEIALSLETRAGSYEVGDQVLASVETEDAFGNPTRDPWTLAVDGGTASVEGNAITFESDGLYTVTATLNDSNLADQEGPILVDSSGPVFNMHFPLHEDATDNLRKSISGSVVDPWSGVLYAAIDGDPVEVGSAGGFLHYRNWDFGMNAVTLSAVDNDGNRTDLVHALLVGDFLDTKEGVPNGLVVHLGKGAGGLDAVLDGVKSEISSIDLSSAFPIAITGTKYDLTIPGIEYAIGDVDIVPTDGELVASASLTDLSIPIEGKVKAVFWLDASGSVDIDGIDVAVSMVPRVTSSGRLVVDVSDTTVTIDNLQLNFDSSLYSVIESIGLDKIIEDYVTAMLEDQLSYQIQLAVQSNVEAALGSLVLEQSLTVLDTSFDITGTFSDVSVDDGGIAVAFDVAISPADGSDLPETTMPGSLSGSYQSPDLSGLGGIAAGMNLDLLNRILYIAWAEGAMDQTLDSTSVGLTPEALQLLFPNATNITFAMEAMLPPVVVPGTLFSQLVAQFGSVRILAVDQNGDTLLDLYVSVILDVAVSTDGSNLIPTLTLNGDPWVEVTSEAVDSTGVINYDALISLLLPQVLDSVSATITAMPIPSVNAASVTVERLSLYGEDSGFLTALGSIDLGR